MLIEALKLTEKRRDICRKLQLTTLEDILRYYPSRYEEYVPTPFEIWKEKEFVFFEGEILTPCSSYRVRRGLSVTNFKVLYEEQEIKVVIYNQPWLHLKGRVCIAGKYEGNYRVSATQVSQKSLEEKKGIEPYYPLKEGIRQKDIRSLIASVLQKNAFSLEENLPSMLLKKHQLISLSEAVEQIHLPSSKEKLWQAISRLKYEEFFYFYGALFYRKKENQSLKPVKLVDFKKMEAFQQSFSFSLTQDQKRAIQEIISDISSNKRMSRLLQGEVGCGKTLVAEVALYANYLAGFQGAMMAPTEILARQHYHDMKKIFASFGVRVALLTADVENASKIRKDLENGDIDILVGTHALFADKVSFLRLGLVVTDEQHRFGVNQRKKLKDKGENVDVLLMSATPIPRTLSATLFGDMDISSIATLPSGRKGCDTYLVKKNSLVDYINTLQEKLIEGRQIYIVAAAIESSEDNKIKDAISLYQSLQTVFARWGIGLLHGKMSAEEKEKTMLSFAERKIGVLVSTTVIEVGINVANATVMVIYDADRFGLSQLHQLRGRVQRGDYRGTCYLLTASKDEEVHHRLSYLCHTNDGFDIAEEDLRLRGPGDLLGTRQSGLPSFVLGNPLRDTRILQAAKEDAYSFVFDKSLKDELFFSRIMEFLRRNIRE